MSYSVRRSTSEDGELLVDIWRSSVAGTHSFVSAVDLAEIDQEVQQFLPQQFAWIALDHGGEAVAFMVVADGTIESLFVGGERRGLGFGRLLIDLAKDGSASLTTIVNEQNEPAVGFYRHLGFIVTARSPIDEQGRCYPILHMRWTA